MVVSLPLLAGCVQSVYPFYEDSDLVFDGSLAGTWVGEGELKPCLLTITADRSRQVRQYNLELLRVPGGCPDLNSDWSKPGGGGQLLQLGQQRFLDVWDDMCGLHTLLKVRANSHTLSLVPIDSDLLADFIRNKTVNLQGRIEGGSAAWGYPDDVLLTSATEDLRKFLRAHADDKNLFRETDALQFVRK